MRSILLIAALALVQACPPSGASPGGEPPAEVADPPPAPGIEVPEPWATDLSTLADAARPHVDRWAAVLHLADAPTSVVPPLIDLLDDGAARYYAVRALAELGDPSADAPLARLLADRDWGPRRYAAMALGQIGSSDPATGRALEAALDDVVPVREDALLALTRLEPVAGGPPLLRFWTQGLSTGLELTVAPLEGAALSRSASLRLAVTLTNRTSHPLILPPQAVVLARGLYLVDEEGRVVHPHTFAEGSRRPATLDETRLEPGASVPLSLPVALERWERGVPVDHELRPAPARWSLVVGPNRYLLDPGAKGDLSLRLVWHPSFVADLIAAVPRKDAFWTGKTASDVLTLTLPPLEQP